MRPTIFHIINSLSLGGAELLLNNTIKLLPEYKHIVVYFENLTGLRDEFISQGVELIYLESKGWKSMPYLIIKLNKVIRERKPLLVHAHLFYSTICARLAVPKHIPFVSTLHSVYSEDTFKNSRKSLMAARLTLKKRHAIVAVSDYVLKDYLRNVSFRGKRFVLYNFLPDEAFQQIIHQPPSGPIKLVAVGNLKAAKNYHYLLQIFKYLKNASLDIYGTGPLGKELTEYIEKEGLNVRICGATDHVPEVFQQYDYFIQASSHEGFGLSVIEAMAAGIPVILSDIPVFREITNELAHFFPLGDASKAAEKITSIFNQEYPVAISEKAFQFVKNQYSADKYRSKLLSIYTAIT